MTFRAPHFTSPSLYAVTWYQSWEVGFNRLLHPSLDKLPVGKQYTDRRDPPQWYQSWEVSFNRLLHPSQDAMIKSTQLYDRGEPPQWYQHWQNRLTTGALQPPFNQKDWPLTPDQRAFRDWSLNLCLDTLFSILRPIDIHNQFDWPLSPDPRAYRDWYWRQVDKLGKDVLPFNQKDWPTPPEFRQYREYQTDFGPQGRLPPFYQTDWPLPYPVVWYQDWKHEYDKLLYPGTDKFPIRQLDWKNPVLVAVPAANNIDPVNPSFIPAVVTFILMPQICL